MQILVVVAAKSGENDVLAHKIGYGPQCRGTDSVLDLSGLIPEDITGTRITKEVASNKIQLSGKYGNGRRFRLVLNRFIDEQLFIFGCGLYAGEGTKGGKGTPFEFANSNPKIVATIMRLLDKLGISKSIISPRLQIRIPKGGSIDSVQPLMEFWSKSMGIPLAKFRKPSVRLKEGAGRSAYGTISIRINSGIIGKLILFWTDQLLRRNTFSNPDRRKGTGSLAMRRQPGVSRS